MMFGSTWLSLAGVAWLANSIEQCCAAGLKYETAIRSIWWFDEFSCATPREREDCSA